MRVLVVRALTRRHVSADHPWSTVFDSKRVIGRNALDEFAIAEAVRHGGRIVPHPSLQRNRFGKPVPRHKWPTCDGCQHDLAFVVRMPPGTAPAAIGSLASHSCVDPQSIFTVDELFGFLRSTHAPPWNRSALEGVLSSGSASERLLLLSPQAAACLVIRTLVESGRSLNAYPTSAVAAVPADFSVLQREATLEAFSRAGIRVGRLLFEPAAAAVAYGLHKDSSVRHVLVFDMGGGTTDVSILYLQVHYSMMFPGWGGSLYMLSPPLRTQAAAFTLIGSAGDGHLGGEDFDDCLLDALRSEAEAAQGGPLIANSEDHGVCSHSWLKQQAESVKVRLSGSNLDSESVPPADWWCRGSHGHNVTGAISVAQFELRCDALFQRSMQPVMDALERANVEPFEVDEVVLVGGSSRLPRVRRLLQETLQRDRLRSTVDPDLAVALGAAMVND